MDSVELLAIRDDPKRWFQGFGRYCDEQTRQPVLGRANVLQRRMFEHYRRCRLANKPCRMAVLKYRRAGSSTGSSALLYTHAHNYNARLGVVGTDYKASSNMLDMLKHFGEHDDFPGWSAKSVAGETKKVSWQDFHAGQNLESVPFEDRLDKMIATKIQWTHGSAVELYTASNPESARSAGLSGYLATECGRWQTGGQLDASETLTSMRNTLPKAGFHVAIEESTANGAQGAFHDTCRRARWPEYAAWVEQFRSCWPLDESEYGRDLQFVFIFAAWFEDERHVERDTEQEVLAADPSLTPDQARSEANRRNAARAQRVKDSLDADPRYFGEKELIALYGQDGPRGQRLGGEVDATVWEQLAWRRGIIANVCTRRGLDEFKQEYPSNPLEAFRASGSPVFDVDGVLALDEMLRANPRAEFGNLDPQRDGSVAWRRTNEREAMFQRWEQPIEGCRYLIAVDTKENSEIIKGTGELDRNSVQVLRDAYRDVHDVWHDVKVVARIVAPNQFDDAPLARLIAPLAKYYGDCIVVVENNKGIGLITRLRDEHQCRLYCSEHWDKVKQSPFSTYGWHTDEGSRRQMVSTGQEYIREQKIEVLDAHIIAELKTFVFNTKGKAEAASGAHDDDVMALLMGLCCLHAATTYPKRAAVSARAPDEHAWK